MLKEFIDRIVDLAITEQSMQLAPTDAPFKIGDRMKIHVPPTPVAQPLEVRTLSGFVDACHQAQEAESMWGDCFVLVESPIEVSLVSQPLGFQRIRERLIMATASTVVIEGAGSDGRMISGFASGAFLPIEWMVIDLQHLFVETDERDALLELIGNVTEEDIRTQVDDGVTQVVTKKDAVSVMTEAAVRNPWLLAPYRTFRSVEQPESPWILRLQKNDYMSRGAGPTAALFLADGGGWELEAIANIVTYLVDAMPDFKVVG